MGDSVRRQGELGRFLVDHASQFRPQSFDFSKFLLHAVKEC